MPRIGIYINGLKPDILIRSAQSLQYQHTGRAFDLDSIQCVLLVDLGLGNAFAYLPT